MMKLYLVVLEHATFSEKIRPALAASWQQRSFAPCQQLCDELQATIPSFAPPAAIGQDPMLALVSSGRLSFNSQRWRCLVGLALLYAAVDVPQVLLPPATLCCLLAPEQYRLGVTSRDQFAPIQQVLFGSRDLVFGGAYYRPEWAGWNDVADVKHLAHYLAAVEPQHWTPADLTDLREITNPTDRAEELAYVQDWFGSLVEIYHRAAQIPGVIVCEQC